MNLRSVVGWSVPVLFLFSFVFVGTAVAQNSLEREIQRLSFQLEDGNVFEKRKAAEALLRINPKDVSEDLRKQIARSFKELAFETHPDDSAIQGLAVWGGKYSVPLLIELMERSRTSPPDGVWDALAKYPTTESTEAVARKLGDFFSHDEAVRTLRKMGPAAEDALIQAAPSRDAKVAIACVQLLGDVGSDKSVPILRKASSSRNADVRDLAKASLKKIRDRAQNGTAPATTSSNSPFNETASASTPRPTTPPSTDDEDAFGSDSTPGLPNDAGDDGWGDVLSEKDDTDRGDWSEINLLLPGEPEGSVTPDAVSLSIPDWKAKPVRLATKDAGMPQALFIGGNRDAPVAAAVYGTGFHRGVSRVELVDLKRAKSVSNFVAPSGVKRCAISPTGAKMLCTAVADLHRGETRLLVYDITKGEPLEKMSWSPYAPEKFDWMRAEIPWVDWVDDDHLITVNGTGQAVLWDLSGAKPKAVYQHDGISSSQAALSPGRTYFALSTPRGVEIFRSSDGALLARMESNSMPVPGSLAFDAEGKQLTLVTGKRVYHWDATTGKQLSDFYCESFQGDSNHCWVDPEMILVGGDLVDLKQRRILWRYEGTGNVKASSAPYQWVAMQSQAIHGLVPFAIPHLAAINARGDEVDSSLFVVKPGVGVTIENQVGDENRDAIDLGLQDAIKECGFEASSDGTVRLVVRLGEVKTEDTSYRRFGESPWGGGGEKVTVETGRTYDVSLEIDGRQAWKTQVMQWSGSAPFHVQTKEGESAQQAVDREREARKGQFTFKIQLPQYVVHPDKAGPVGTSQLTLGGIK